MTMRQVYNIINNQLVIDLPDRFKGKEQVVVTIDDDIDSKEAKILLLKQALQDPLFLEDVKEIEDDFNAIESDKI